MGSTLSGFKNTESHPRASIARAAQGPAQDDEKVSNERRKLKVIVDGNNTYIQGSNKILSANGVNSFVSSTVYIGTDFADTFSAQKEFGKHYILYIKANNLLNTPFQLIVKQHNNAYKTTTQLPFQESTDYLTVQYDKFYASYLIGFRFKF